MVSLGREIDDRQPSVTEGEPRGPVGPGAFVVGSTMAHDAGHAPRNDLRPGGD